jgi:hypothetical protein
LSGSPFTRHGLASRGDWPLAAVVDGRLEPPPAAHLLDHLVRQHVLIAPEEWPFLDFPDLELLLEEPGTIAIASGDRLPTCDLCDRAGRPTRRARYDGPTSRRKDPPWGFMCPDCFAVCSPRLLGLGRGQYLIERDEIPTEVRDAFFVARKFWIEAGANPPPHDPFQ